MSGQSHYIYKLSMLLKAFGDIIIILTFKVSAITLDIDSIVKFILSFHNAFIFTSCLPASVYSASASAKHVHIDSTTKHPSCW